MDMHDAEGFTGDYAGVWADEAYPHAIEAQDRGIADRRDFDGYEALRAAVDDVSEEPSSYGYQPGCEVVEDLETREEDIYDLSGRVAMDACHVVWPLYEVHEGLLPLAVSNNVRPLRSRPADRRPSNRQD